MQSENWCINGVEINHQHSKPKIRILASCSADFDAAFHRTAFFPFLTHHLPIYKGKKTTKSQMAAKRALTPTCSLYRGRTRTSNMVAVIGKVLAATAPLRPKRSSSGS
ncbi:hypothetical protein, unlikely [Trypanosoma brucei gambiense DAL972]|uniref:Uncharacterized protein n=1 Tax=Trypanosoma brucei gambiense (strain MHOM/CI/86/DAL972) TaxID=679716 RepID=D0A4N0_TRYB9|nr:hypothetical protein, unlikely [Trypanosoma brucei gambiense DAL972]CBH16224.1 hypothetical protein, unlikely [Trypanosoma brucei gambiense DAL972]|eukprot:XP_011778488.1 hypothetical protein, unlikely [Trypanosoma brucei gambiense DAL972]